MEWDAEAGPNGLYKTWFRYYDHTQGRWMGVDPVPGGALIPQTLNRYAYVMGNPSNLTDPLGLDPCASKDGFRSETAYNAFCSAGGRADLLSCELDGVLVPCGMAFRSLSTDGAEQCANNNCDPMLFLVNGKPFLVLPDGPNPGFYEWQQGGEDSTGKSSSSMIEVIGDPGRWAWVPSVEDRFPRKLWRFGGLFSLLAGPIDRAAQKLPPGRPQRIIRTATASIIASGGTVEVINGALYMTIGAFGALPTGGVSYLALVGGAIQYGLGVADIRRAAEIFHEVNLSRIASGSSWP